jgi:hypothetical protein
MAYTGFRQVQFRKGATTLDLASSPYKIEAGSWGSSGRGLELKIIAQATTLAELDASVAALQRMATLATAYDQMFVGDPVEVWTKTCDNITTTAEMGATWQRKRVRQMTVTAADPSTSAAGRYVVTVTVSAEVDETWRRAAPSAVLIGSSLVSSRSDGGISSAAAAVTARRIAWTSSTGVTARYRWLKANANCDFFKVAGTTIKGWWDNANRRFRMQDNAGTPAAAQSAQYTFTDGQEVEVTFRWAPGVGQAIFVNGVKDGTATTCAFAQANTFTVFEPTGTQELLSCQVWPAALTDAQCQDVYNWGRPESELPFLVPPPNSQARSAGYKVYNGPGDAPSPLRIILDGASQDFAQVRFGWRPLRIPTEFRWEVEDGTLGADTVKTANATCSNGQMARVTPTDTAWGTRSTLVIAANPADVAAMRGEHRLLLAAADHAATVGINLVRWRLVVAGQAEDWSEEFEASWANATTGYTLIDLGEMRIPPGWWPEETFRATTDVTGGSYITLELQTSNSSGSGGGTIDLDAVFLQPAEAEGLLNMRFDVSAYFALVDWTGERAACIGVADERSLEFSAWGSYVGDALELMPNAGAGGLLLAQWLRSEEQYYPLDTCDVFLFVEPRHRR